jgi:hypothetical protein
MTRISVVQLFVALAVLALALAQTVTTTVTVVSTYALHNFWVRVWVCA